MPKRKVISKNKTLPQTVEAKKEKEVTLEEVAKLLDEFFDELGGSFDRIEATLDRMIHNSRKSNRSLNESLGRLETAANSIGTYTVSSGLLPRRVVYIDRSVSPKRMSYKERRFRGEY